MRYEQFRAYAPEQAWLLPPSIQDVLGEGHLSCFIQEIVEQLDVSQIEKDYSEEGQPGYHPKLLLKVWLYAYCLGVTSSRRVAQRTREDLGFRYLAGGAEPGYWTLNAFRRRHPRAINDLFTQVLEWARGLGWGRLGHVALDSTRVAANASRDRILSEEGLRQRQERSCPSTIGGHACRPSPNNCGSCANRDRPSCQPPTPRAAFCGSVAALLWAIPRIWRSVRIT